MTKNRVSAPEGELTKMVRSVMVLFGGIALALSIWRLVIRDDLAWQFITVSAVAMLGFVGLLGYLRHRDQKRR